MEAILKRIDAQLVEQNEAIRNLNSKVDSALQSFDALSVKLESVVNQLPDGIRSSDGGAPPAKQRRRSLMELPAEVQTEIFLRMPVSSILSCKCVCKPFNNLIKNPNFIQAHLNRINPISEDTQSLIFHFGPDIEVPYCQYDHFLVSIDNNTKDPLSYLPLTPPIPRVGEFDQYYMVGSCNGLICLAVRYEDRWKDWIFLLWNPVINQRKYLPEPMCTSSPSALEFGYVPETNDYVIVKVTHKSGFEIEECGVYVEMYKMSIDSWIVIDSSVFAEDDLITTVTRYENSVFLNGAFHWTFIRDGINYVLYYNLKDEKLGLMKALDNDRALITNELNHDTTSEKEWKLAVIDESLAMIYWIEDENSRLEVWAMNEYGVETSWALRFQIVHDISTYLSPVGYWTSGNLMIIEDQGGHHLYDLNTKKMKKLPVMAWYWFLTGFCSYVETLVPVR